MIKNNHNELIKLIGILDNDSYYTELKAADIYNLDDDTVISMIKQVKSLSDYYVKYKLLYNTIPFSLDVDIINGQCRIGIVDVYTNITIPYNVHEIYIGHDLVDNIADKSAIKLDLRDVKVVHFDRSVATIQFRDLIIKGIIQLSNNQIHRVELKLLHSNCYSVYSLINVTHYIIKYHIEHVKCKDKQIVEKFKQCEILRKDIQDYSKDLKQLTILHMDIVDELDKWSKQHNVV